MPIDSAMRSRRNRWNVGMGFPLVGDFHAGLVEGFAPSQCPKLPPRMGEPGVGAMGRGLLAGGLADGR